MFQQPPPLPARGRRHFISLLLVWMMGVAILGMMLLLVVPRFEVFFKDFKVSLPGTTQFWLSCSRMVRQFGPIPAGVAAVGVVAAAVLAGMALPRVLYRMVVTLSGILLAGLVIWCFFSMYLPMLTLADAVTGKQ